MTGCVSVLKLEYLPNKSLLNFFFVLIISVKSKKRAIVDGDTPLARIVSWGIVGLEPAIMAFGPVPSSMKALENAGLTVEDIDRKIAELQNRREATLKDEKKDAIAEVKRLIATYGISKGDLRGTTMNMLNGKKK